MIVVPIAVVLTTVVVMADSFSRAGSSSGGEGATNGRTPELYIAGAEAREEGGMRVLLGEMRRWHEVHYAYATLFRGSHKRLHYSKEGNSVIDPVMEYSYCSHLHNIF